MVVADARERGEAAAREADGGLAGALGLGSGGLVVWRWRGGLVGASGGVLVSRSEGLVPERLEVIHKCMPAIVGTGCRDLGASGRRQSLSGLRRFFKPEGSWCASR